VGSLGAIVGAFKSSAARRISTLTEVSPGTIWQRGYYERVIRDGDELTRVREYIRDNPAKWNEDPDNPAASADATQHNTKWVLRV